jgi:hypothetical protein
MSENKKISSFEEFNEAVRVKDMASIPPGYLDSVTQRAKTRLNIANQPEGGAGVSAAGGEMMANWARSQELSRGHEEELENLAKKIITKLYKPILDFYDIKLDIKMSSGPQMRNFIDQAFKKTDSGEGPPPGKTRPVVRARGVDFSMLIHETVKGIWRVLSQSGASGDKELDAAVESQFRLADEPDEWRYGPEIAKDLKDFIFQNPKVLIYDNLAEEIWLYMTRPEVLPSEEFLNLMTGILSQTPAARKKIDEIIEVIIKQVGERDLWLKQEYENQEKQREYLEKKAAYDAYLASEKGESVTVNYSTKSKEELREIIRKAKEENDFATLKEIATYLKNNPLR